MRTAADLLPAPEWATRHERAVAAAPERALAAVRSVTPAEMLLARALLTVRSLPALLAGRPGLAGRAGAPLVEGLLAAPGFALLDESPTGLTLAYVGQPWRLAGGEHVEVGDADAFLAFARPGFVRVVADALARPGWLATETRIVATDAGARRRFAPYWTLVRPGSGIVRRQWLAAAARRAEG